MKRKLAYLLAGCLAISPLSAGIPSYQAFASETGTVSDNLSSDNLPSEDLTSENTESEELPADENAEERSFEEGSSQISSEDTSSDEINTEESPESESGSEETASEEIFRCCFCFSDPAGNLSFRRSRSRWHPYRASRRILPYPQRRL